MTVEIEGNKIPNLIKRNGSSAPFDETKLRKVAHWACGEEDWKTDLLLKTFHIKINEGMKIQHMFDELIETAATMVSSLYPFWDKVASNLFCQKLYKEAYNLSHHDFYPDYKDVVKKGLLSKGYGKAIFGLFSDEEIETLGNMIKPERDFLFSYSGLHIFTSKYCMNANKTSKLELPQHAYLRMAIFDFHKDKGTQGKGKKGMSRMDYIRETYETLSKHDVTMATPHAINGGSPRSQIASCVLNTTGDSTESISRTDANMALYSKFSGGLANDVCAVRASNSPVAGNRGKSGGPVPFIKKFESTVTSFDQGGVRKGSCVITYAWWHYDVMDMMPLKDAGGSESKRARHLQYAMRVSNILKDRVKSNGNVTLFDPKETPELVDTYGDEFDKWYLHYEAKSGIRRRTMKAHDLWFPFLKFRQETGNKYVTLIDNINMQNVTQRFVGAANLCTEIVIPSRASEFLGSKVVRDEFSGVAKIIEEWKAGEIGLCNLASINLYNFSKMTQLQKWKLIYNLLRAMDNVIDTQFYPVPEAEYSNRRHRPIGIGVLNYASWLASLGVKITDPEALLHTHTMFEELSYMVYEASCELAKERGAYSQFHTSSWAKGVLPVDLSILGKSRKKINYPLTQNWDTLREKIKVHGVRFSLHMAIAPTATSGKSIGATESTEPVPNLFYMEEGTSTIPSIAHKLKEHRKFYVTSFSVPNKQILELAGIRQRFLDQAQSVNTYYADPSSAKEMSDDIFYAMELGLKSLYYLKTPKSDTGEVCEVCT